MKTTTIFDNADQYTSAVDTFKRKLDTQLPRPTDDALHHASRLVESIGPAAATPAVEALADAHDRVYNSAVNALIKNTDPRKDSALAFIVNTEGQAADGYALAYNILTGRTKEPIA